MKDGTRRHTFQPYLVNMAATSVHSAKAVQLAYTLNPTSTLTVTPTSTLALSPSPALWPSPRSSLVVTHLVSTNSKTPLRLSRPARMMCCPRGDQNRWLHAFFSSVSAGATQSAVRMVVWLLGRPDDSGHRSKTVG